MIYVSHTLSFQLPFEHTRSLRNVYDLVIYKMEQLGEKINQNIVMYNKKGDPLDTNLKIADLAKDKALFFGITFAEWQKGAKKEKKEVKEPLMLSWNLLIVHFPGGVTIKYSYEPQYAVNTINTMLSSLDLFVKEMKKLDDGSELVVYDESNAKIGLKLKLNELNSLRILVGTSWDLWLVSKVKKEIEEHLSTIEESQKGYRIYLPRGEIVFLPNHSKDSTLHSLTQKLAEKKNIPSTVNALTDIYGVVIASDRTLADAPKLGCCLGTNILEWTYVDKQKTVGSESERDRIYSKLEELTVSQKLEFVEKMIATSANKSEALQHDRSRGGGGADKKKSPGGFKLGGKKVARGNPKGKGTGAPFNQYGSINLQQLIETEMNDFDKQIMGTGREKTTRHLMQKNYQLSDLELFNLYLKEEKKHVPNFSVPYRYEKEDVAAVDYYKDPFKMSSSEDEEGFPAWVEKWNDKVRVTSSEYSKTATMTFLDDTG